MNSRDEACREALGVRLRDIVTFLLFCCGISLDWGMIFLHRFVQNQINK